MNKRFTKFDLAVFMLLLLPLVYTVIMYFQMPDGLFPSHFNAEGKADEYNTLTNFLGLQLIPLGVALFAYLFMKPSFYNQKYPVITLKKLTLALILFYVSLDLFITYGATHKDNLSGDRVIGFLFGLLFAFSGNLMHSLKPNYFIGLKTFWTIENEDNWRATHRLGSRVWLTGGIILALASLIVPTNYIRYTFLCIAAILVLVPIIYSYYYYNKYQKPKP